MMAVRPVIRLERVSKAFAGQPVLTALSLDVHRGQALVVLGRSGTGKSVMLKHIVGLVRPDAGKVYVEDDEVSALPASDLARVRTRIGFLFQNAALFDSISVGENVEFPLRRHTHLSSSAIVARAREKLAAVGLEHAYHKMPAELSGGMRKRAGLARAMALDPPILLVDEPSAGLDPITAAEIDQLLLGVNRTGGTTLVVVTHHMTSARTLAHELVFLHEGHVLARGPVAELDANPSDLVRAFMRSDSAG